MSKKPIYLDCNATTPVEPSVAAVAIQFMTEEYGNAGSRTHEFGARAKSAVIEARRKVADLLSASADEVFFTSGATESNNISILGLAKYGREKGKLHIVTGAHEHKAVLEPIDRLKAQGFEVTFLTPGENGMVSVADFKNAIRSDTLLVSMMHVNNETGVVQPISEYAKELEGHDAYFHVDASQSFGKIIPDLRNKRIDLISASGHKIYAPKGIGILLARCRRYKEPPIDPIMVGGGQERGLRPGTLPVHLIVALGEAVDLASKNNKERTQICRNIKEKAVKQLISIGGIPNGNQSSVIENTLNISFPGLDSEAIILQLKDLVSISNGSACTSSSYTFSHVLTSMGLTKERIKGSIRISWCHMTPTINWEDISKRISLMNS